MIRRAWVRWRARRLHRAALCTWCGQYVLPGQLPARTIRGSRVHLVCLVDAEADEFEAAAW